MCQRSTSLELGVSNLLETGFVLLALLVLLLKVVSCGFNHLLILRLLHDTLCYELLSEALRD